MLIEPVTGFNGRLEFPGDKSISHRLVLISLLLNGSLNIENIGDGADVATSLQIVEQLGVKVDRRSNRVLLVNRQTVSGDGRPVQEINCGNSGTSVRLLAGILAGFPGTYRLTGDESLSRRPMLRVSEPLADMGADIACDLAGTLPMLIKGKSDLGPISFVNRHGSAQVKSAILLAGSLANGETVVTEPLPSRDHSERLLAQLGAPITFKPGEVRISGPFKFSGHHAFCVPGDISSAAFFALAAAIFPGSRVVLDNVLLNPSRTGFLEVLQRMGASVVVEKQTHTWEPMGSVVIEGRELRPTRISPREIPGLVDEIPALAVAMAFAGGRSTISGAGELRYKESDRLAHLAGQFRKAGIQCGELPDGLIIEGNTIVPGGSELDPAGDHRLAMAFTILGLRSQRGSVIKNSECVKISFHHFFDCCYSCIKSRI